MIALLVSLLAIGPQSVPDQRAVVPDGTTISAASVSGFDIDRLSPGLRHDIHALAGTPLQQARLDQLAARIEEERPRHVAAVRATLEPDGQARVVFLVGERGSEAGGENVNARYLVEAANITGAADGEIPGALLDDLHALVGKPLDYEQADRLQERMRDELPRYQVRRRIYRGSEQGRVRVVFELTRFAARPWLRYEPLRSNVVFHSDQKWGGYLDLGIGGRDIRFTPILAIADGDDLVEEYSGWGLRFETRRIGTRRLGASLEWTSFDPDWRAQTLDAINADPSLPSLYDTRTTLTPLVKFAFTPELTIAAGVGVTELDPLAPATASRMANVAIGALDFDKRWDAGRSDQRLESEFRVRSGTHTLESDLAYKRYSAQASYEYAYGHHHAVATAMAGRASNTAPVFERFTLGDTRTLRGWDKYAIAPAGGSRMVYASVEYGYRGVGVFLDMGSVWDQPSDRRFRVSTGLSFHAGPAFASVGFPLNTDNLTAVFSMGVRIGETKLRW
jgi:hypothetical protein